MGSAIGIIANPVSARDIRRVIANATALQITDRANIVLRVLSCVKACGVDTVYMMPENGGIRHHVRRGIDRAENQGLKHFPKLEYLDYKISGTVDDTLKAARLMKEKGVAAIVVLGGDGTHRAVVTVLRRRSDCRHLDGHQQRVSRTPRADHHRTGRGPRGDGQGSGGAGLPAQQEDRRCASTTTRKSHSSMSLSSPSAISARGRCGAPKPSASCS